VTTVGGQVVGLYVYPVKGLSGQPLRQDRQASAAFFAQVLDLPPGQHPVIAYEEDRRFTDASVVSDAMMHAVSIINLASVRALEKRIGQSLDPLRFRANVYVDGWPPFAELGLLSEAPMDGPPAPGSSAGQLPQNPDLAGRVPARAPTTRPRNSYTAVKRPSSGEPGADGHEDDVGREERAAHWLSRAMAR
jgi:MOSC domain-containing protein